MTDRTDIYFPTAQAFLESLRRSNDVWWPADARSSPWIFRGVGDADQWKLLPIAWRCNRDNALKPLYEQIREKNFELPCDEDESGNCRRYWEWMAAEKEALFQFAVLANEAGFQVEASTYAHACSPLTTRSLGTAGQKEVVGKLEDMARAQHHGIPTRLLDWSVNPLVAAFFAAYFRPEPSKSICVWALNRIDVQLLNEKRLPEHKLRVVVHEPPWGRDSYQLAQGGVFTEVIGESAFFIENGQWPSLEDVFSQKLAMQPTLIRHTLDGKDAPCLLRLLEREGISLAALMPNLDKVAEAVVARWNYAASRLDMPSG